MGERERDREIEGGEGHGRIEEDIRKCWVLFCFLLSCFYQPQAVEFPQELSMDSTCSTNR